MHAYKDKVLMGVTLLLLLIPPCFAKEKMRGVPYMETSTFKIEAILPPPVETGSLQSKQELESMKRIMASLTQDQKDLAKKDALNLDVSFFADVIVGFDVDQLPKTKMLFDQVKYNAEYESNLFKNYFMKKRPYQEDADIHVCVAPKPSNLNRTYPSGHTTLGYAMGIVLANLIPESSRDIMARARLYGENRVNCGAHFPTDVAAGQVLGTLVATELLKNNEFKALMKASRDELILAGFTH